MHKKLNSLITIHSLELSVKDASFCESFRSFQYQQFLPGMKYKLYIGNYILKQNVCSNVLHFAQQKKFQEVFAKSTHISSSKFCLVIYDNTKLKLVPCVT